MLNKHCEVKSRHKHRRAYIYKDIVIKEFDYLDDFKTELSSYKKLSSIINNILLDEGWLLKSPKVINVKSKDTHCIEMDCMPGDTIDNLCFNKQEIPWELIGKALRLFHCKAFKIYNKQLIYYDFGLSNVMCSKKNQIISFIDPGAFFLTNANQSNDVYLFLWSIFMYRLKGARIPLAAERKFLESYFLNTEAEKLQSRNLMPIIKNIRQIFSLRINQEHKKDSILKKIIYNILKEYFIITRALKAHMIINKLKC